MVWKADFSENNSIKKILSTPKISFGYIHYIFSEVPITRPPIGWHSIGRVSGAGMVVVASPLAFLKVSRITAITSFLQFFP